MQNKISDKTGINCLISRNKIWRKKYLGIYLVFFARYFVQFTSNKKYWLLVIVTNSSKQDCKSVTLKINVQNQIVTYTFQNKSNGNE